MSSSILFKEYRITSAVLMTSVSKGWVFGLLRPGVLKDYIQRSESELSSTSKGPK